ncbi:hypothetical protein BBD42_16840 [Paenibacillus sp. BIHB 4019]|uniref:FHA domain-containing protein n=1 Tax=Paenibacillus sp. BIHB 4019 TaxID=1870819 RepID=A0A1B2DJQ3_9BACL|nr:DUF6382 domain-containing protein [Paenibacillus sp. BIHB 4019]ANY67954.1 hypothetical protein BBD42_16840 [Paenibacillus sp. BIHB 4019]
MGNFIVDYAMNRGHELIMDREGGIRRQELEEVELQMLQGSSIPHLLPIEWFELNGLITFSYRISGKKLLLHRLQIQSLTMEKFYAVLLGIIEALDECHHYMLRPEGCLLEESYLFVGEQLSDIFLVYMPLKSINSGQSAPNCMHSLLALAIRWSSYIEEINGEEFQYLLHLLSREDATISTIRSQLLERISKMYEGIYRLHGSAPSTSRPNPASSTSNAINANIASSPYIAGNMRPDKVGDYSSSNHYGEAGEFGRDSDNIKKSETNLQESLNDRFFADGDWDIEVEPLPQYNFTEEETAPARKGKWLISAMIFVAVACIWRYIYLAAPSSSLLFICLGLSLIGVAGLLALWLKKSIVAESELVEEDNLREDRNKEEFSRSRFRRANENGEEGVQHSSSSIDLEVAVPPFKKSVSSQTGSTRREEATVLLGQHNKKTTADSGFSLQREWEGQGQRLIWEKGRFTIGRIGEQVSYGDEAQGISRLHLECNRDDKGCFIKDLGSRNGSMLNGQTMIAYKTYPFSVGDIVQLAGVNGPKYELKQGS